MADPMNEQTPADVIARLTASEGDDPYSTNEPVTLPGIADLHQERGEHKSAAAIRQAVKILTARQRFYAVQLGDDDGWVVMRDDPINGTPVWRFNEFPPSPLRGDDAHRLAELLNDAAGFRVSSKPDDDTRREVEGLRPWCFIAEGDERQINYAAHEDHDYAVLIGDNHWWCAGCLSKPPRRFTEDGYSMWPNLVAAPNGLRLVIEPVVDGMNVARRPLCPRSLAGEVRSDG